MKAVVLSDEGLAVRDVPVPEPKPNEVLVKVSASGLNRADLIMVAGRPHGALGGAGTIAGLEWAGEVAAVGAEVPEFRPGDQVMCSGAGGYAEYAVTDCPGQRPIRSRRRRSPSRSRPCTTHSSPTAASPQESPS